MILRFWESLRCSRCFSHPSLKGLGLLLVLSVSSPSILAAPTSFTYQGRILRNDGAPLEYSNVGFIFQITDPSGQCVIYQEYVSGINLSNSQGVFDVPIGQGTVTWPLSGNFSVLDSINNTANFSCGSCVGYSCTPGIS